MGSCKKLLLPSVFSVLFCFSLLSANLEERGSEGPLEDEYVRSFTDEDKIEYEETVSTIPADNSNKVRVHPSLPRHQALIFDPPTLDFRESAVGMPRLETVRITNPSSTQPLQLTSISGDSPTFHASFFKSKVVKAGESTSFDVVFLARMTGSARNLLYIQSSQGTFEYEVQGVGTPNPFRLRSLLGARIPLNATYSPLISMYNPYSKTLQITEMYSSSGELHLELLTGQTEGPKALWEIRPYETKTIARASFFGASVANYTSFVRVRMNHKGNPSVVLPVEVEVSDHSGLFLSRELLDFGVVKGGETKVLPLYVLNAGQQQVHIKSVSISPENSAVEVEYMTTLLRPGSKYTKIALLKLHADRVSSQSQTRGSVVIRAEDRFPHQLEVPYDASVLTGSLSYDKAATLFRPGPPPFQPIMRHIPLSNQFESPVVVYDAKLPTKAQEYFAISAEDTPFTLPPSTHWSQSLAVLFVPSSTDCFFNTTLRLSTNATYFNIPLICYDGRVKYSLENSDEDSLEFGVLSQSDTVSKTFTLHNINPVQISIISYSVSANLPFTSVQLSSVHPTTNGTPHPPSHSTPPHTLEPEHSAQFIVTVSNPNTISTYSGEVIVSTSFDKVLHVPVYFKTAESRLKVSPGAISFKGIFPYLRARVGLSARNLFHKAVDVTSVNSDLDDPRVYFEESVDGLPRLRPTEKVEIGSVVIDPLLGDTVYLKKPASSLGLWSSNSAPQDPSRELQLLTTLWASWRGLVDDGRTVFNDSIVVSSVGGGEVRVPVDVSLAWPNLVKEKLVTLEPTTVGNTSIHRLRITNPSDVPLLVQPVFLSHYTHPQTIIDSLLDRFDPRLRNLNFSHLSNSFSFVSSASPETALATTLLPPHSKLFEMAVAFSPKVDQELNTLLLLRNNLTVFDYVIVQGSGVQGSFAIDSVQPGTEPLMFEFPNSVMENCLAGTVVDPLADPLKLTKTFRMHNSGSTSITLRIIGLEGGSCDGRGFVISNCNKDITIKPNRSKKIEITFTPDYTLTQVSTTLRLQTSTGNEFLYPLLAILPHQLLAACIALQPRPEWEKTLAWLSVPFWLLVILCLVATVFVQTKFGMRSSSSVSYKSEAKATKGSGEVFDLKKLSKSMDVLSKKVQELGEKSSNQKSESTGQSMKIEVTREPPKPSTDKNTPVSKPKPEPLVTPTTAQEIPTLRHRVVQNKIERKPSSQETITSLQPVPSRSHTAVTSTPKGMSLKIPIAPVTEPSVISPPRTGTDNHTGAREQTQPCTPTTGAPVQLCSSPTKLKRSNEKTIPEKTASKGEIISKTPTENNPSSLPANVRKSKIVRKFKPLKITPDSSPLPPSGRKELERKVSESSIVSSNSDSASTGTDKSEEVETPSQVVTVVAEVKKPPPPVTKEPNTGQTIHPPDTPESTEVMSPRTELVDKKEPPISTVRMKGKRKPRQQIKKEEKARKKERGRDKEREKEKDTDKTDAKQLVGSFEDSSSSNSTEQLDNDSTPPLEDTVQTETETNVQCDKTTENELNKLLETTIIDVSPNKGNEIPVLVSPAVPSTAIKTGRTTKTTKQETKETFTDSFSRTPDQAATYGTKKISTGKKPSEKIKSPVVEKITQLVEDNLLEHQLKSDENVRQRPQTLHVVPIIRSELIEEPVIVIPMDSDSLVETDGVTHTLLSVDSGKGGSQSLPTSPHELAASLLSNNSAIMRRKQKSDRDKPDDGQEDDDYQLPEQDEQSETEMTKPIEAPLSPQKDESSHNSSDNEFKPPLSTLSLNAEPFYPSPTFAPKSGPSLRADPRKFGPDHSSQPRGPPPGLSPTPDDAHMRPYPEGSYFKRPHPLRGGKSMTPSPPLPYFPEGSHMPYSDYPSLEHHNPMAMDEPYSGPENFPPMPMGRHSREHYRGRSPMMAPKSGHGRQHMHPNMEAYMHHLYMQRAREYSYRPQGPWDHHHHSHRLQVPPMEEGGVYDQQYLRKRQYIMKLIERERAIAAMERDQPRHPIDAPSPAKFGPDVSPSSIGSRGWDNPDFSEQSPEDPDLIPYRQSNLLPERPRRSRTYSMESDLGGEFVTDFPAVSAVGAPGQQFSSRGEKGSVSSKSLAPGRSRSAGWPAGEGKSTSPNWDSPNTWSTDTAPFYSNDITSDMSPLPISSSTTDPTSPSEDTTLSTTTYDLFENQSIWSLSNADSSTLLSWAQQKSEPPLSKTE